MSGRTLVGKKPGSPSNRDTPGRPYGVVLLSKRSRLPGAARAIRKGNQQAVAFRGVGESGRPRHPHKVKTAGSNPAPTTKCVCARNPTGCGEAAHRPAMGERCRDYIV